MTRAHRNSDLPGREDAALWQQLHEQPIADDPVTRMLVTSGLPVLHGVTLPLGTNEIVEIDHVFASAAGIHALHSKHYIAWANAPSLAKEPRSQGEAGSVTYNNDFLCRFLKLEKAINANINDPSLHEVASVPVTSHFLLPYKMPLVASLKGHALLMPDLATMLDTLIGKGTIPPQYGNTWCHIGTLHYKYKVASSQIQHQNPL